MVTLVRVRRHRLQGSWWLCRTEAINPNPLKWLCAWKWTFNEFGLFPTAPVSKQWSTQSHIEDRSPPSKCNEPHIEAGSAVRGSPRSQNAYAQSRR